MGVMSCFRPDCESIMCDTYVDGVGYVCRECQSEFQEYVQFEGLEVDTEGAIKDALKEFKKTSKGKYALGEDMSIDDFFNKHTR